MCFRLTTQHWKKILPSTKISKAFFRKLQSTTICIRRKKKRWFTLTHHNKRSVRGRPPVSSHGTTPSVQGSRNRNQLQPGNRPHAHSATQTQCPPPTIVKVHPFPGKKPHQFSPPTDKETSAYIAAVGVRDVHCDKHYQLKVLIQLAFKTSHSMGCHQSGSLYSWPEEDLSS